MNAMRELRDAVEEYEFRGTDGAAERLSEAARTLLAEAPPAAVPAGYDEDEIADACMMAEVSDSKYEAIITYLSDNRRAMLAAPAPQAGVVEALPAEMTLERSPALYDGVSGQQAYVWGYNDCRAAALAAIKGETP